MLPSPEEVSILAGISEEIYDDVTKEKTELSDYDIDPYEDKDKSINDINTPISIIERVSLKDSIKKEKRKKTPLRPFEQWVLDVLTNKKTYNDDL